MSAARLRVLVPFGAGVAAFLYFAFGRDWPFPLALLIGAAIMLLGWAAVRTWERLRELNE